MKKYIVLIAVAALLLGLSSCRKSPYYPEELLELDLSPTMGTVSLRVDSRRGLRQTGSLKTIIKFRMDIGSILSQDSRWLPYPLDEQTDTLIHKTFRDLGKFTEPITDGYYILLNPHTGFSPLPLGEEEYHFIFAVYEPHLKTMYYSEIKK